MSKMSSSGVTGPLLQGYVIYVIYCHMSQHVLSTRRECVILMTGQIFLSCVKRVTEASVKFPLLRQVNF